MKTLPTSEAANRAGVEETTITRWCRAGYIKYKRVGLDKAYEISSRSLDEYLKSRKLAPHGYIHINTAANYCGIPSSTLRRMAEDGRLKSKRVSKRLYINKKSLESVAATYDAKESLRKSGRRSAAILEGREPTPAPERHQRPPVTQREIEHCHTLAWIENLVRK
jgi:excisionase family DNA binding protein